MPILIVLVFTFAVSGSALAQESTGAKEQVDLRELANPGPKHEKLATCAGHWKVTIHLGAGGSAPVYSGTASNRMVVGNRFLLCEMRATGDQGDVEGILTLGLDRLHEGW